MAVRFQPFKGRALQGVAGLQQRSAKGFGGHIRIGVASVGWDDKISKLKNIPIKVEQMLRKTSKLNAERMAELAKEYVPHGLETDRLLESITAVPVEGKKYKDIAYAVEADTPYAHFVEMDVHPSYGARRNAAKVNRWGTVFGARQGDPQGPHYLERAMTDMSQEAQDSMADAINKGIDMGIRSARRGFSSKRMDFSTHKALNAYLFVESAVKAGFSPPEPKYMASGGLNPLDAELRGL